MNNIDIIDFATSQQTYQEKASAISRKLKLLKETVRQQREANQQLEDSLFRAYEEIKKKETESKRRDDKNEGLLLEIRVLRDLLISEKTQRQKLEARIQSLQSKAGEGQGRGILSSSNYFGLKKLFQR